MKVLIAVEGSEFSKAAIEKVCLMFAESKNTEIRIISAFELTLPSHEPFAVSPDYVRRLEAELRERAEEIVAEAEAEIRRKIPAANLTTETVAGSPARVIVEEAELWGADLIVVGSHGFGFWRRTLLGSVSNSVAHHAPCSVLIVRK